MSTTAVTFRFAFMCPFCCKERQRVMVGTDDATGAIVVVHPWPDDCDTWRHHSSTPRSRAAFVRLAMHEVLRAVA